MKISEIKNNLPTTKPLKEIMSLNVPNVNPSLPHRNGAIYAIIGSPGSGKSNLLFSTLFRNSHYYRSKFDNIYLITPESSFLSLEKHPFKDHDKVFHELSNDILEVIYDEILELKKQALDEDRPIEHSCIIIDDFADGLKDPSIIMMLKKLLIKSRHLNTFFIFTLQYYNAFPLALRKLITNITLFKPKNNIEMESIRGELLHLNKDDFQELTNYVFDQPYNHLDYDTSTMQIQKNYNLLNIEK
jgi:ABC-type dipeptide/oligopeptide/nickel transport system ATPase component